jgi:hypothetical protein
MKKKISFQLENQNFEIESTALRTKSWGGEPCQPYIYLTQKHVASIMKQYVKNNYPGVEVWAKSQSYAGGDSVDVYICKPNGEGVDEQIVKDVNRFSTYFEEGKFNGMIDMYEHKEENMSSDNGTVIKGGTKYAFVRNGAPFGTTPDVVRMLKAMMAGEYVWGVVTLETAIQKVKGYKIPDVTINKALQLL